MSARSFNLYEQEATLDAGNKGGELLDSFGVTDLASLNEEQFAKFVRTVVDEFGNSIRRQIVGGKPPF